MGKFGGIGHEGIKGTHWMMMNRKEQSTVIAVAGYPRPFQAGRDTYVSKEDVCAG